MTDYFTHIWWSILLSMPILVMGQMGYVRFDPNQIPQRSGQALLDFTEMSEVYGNIDEALLQNPTKSRLRKSLAGTWEVARNIGPDATASTLGLKWEPVYIPEKQVTSSPEEGNYSAPAYHLYRRAIYIQPEWSDQQISLHTFGVGGAFDLFINERPVASSHRGLIPSGFDISKALRPGKNWLYILLKEGTPTQWLEHSHGMSGDIWLLLRPSVRIGEVAFLAETLGTSEKGRWKLGLELAQLPDQGLGSVNIKAQLREIRGATIWQDEAKVKISKEKNTIVQFDQRILNIQAWNAEQPHQYQLIVSLIDRKGKTLEVYSQKIGFRRISWKKNQLWVNGAEVLLRGMAFHPSQFRDSESLISSLKMMKAHNINALYLKEFASAQVFDLADTLGFYVFQEVGYGSRIKPRQDRELWKSLLVDYALGQVAQLEKHPSVVGVAVDDPFLRPVLQASLKRVFPHIQYIKKDDYRDKWILIDRETILKDKLPSQFWDTTAHFMADNWSDEWIPSPSARAIRQRNHPAMMLKPGYINPDGQARPALTILKKWYEPVSLSLFLGNPSLVYIGNEYAFLSMEDYKLVYKACTVDGPFTIDTLPLKPIYPGSLAQIVLPSRITNSRKNQPGSWLEVNLINPEGIEIAWTQKASMAEEALILTGVESPKVIESVSTIDVVGSHFHLTFDKGVGMLNGLWLDNREIWSGPFQLGMQWQGEEKMWFAERPEQILLENVEVHEVSKEVEIFYTGKWVKGGTRFPFKVMFTILGNGRVYVDCQIKGVQADRIIPCIHWQVSDQLGKLTWLGPGPTLPVSTFTQKGKWGAYEADLGADYFKLTGHAPEWEVKGVAKLALKDKDGFGLTIYPLRKNAIQLTSQSQYFDTQTWLPTSSGTHVSLYPSAENQEDKSLLGGKRLTFRVDLIFPEHRNMSESR